MAVILEQAVKAHQVGTLGMDTDHTQICIRDHLSNIGRVYIKQILTSPMQNCVGNGHTMQSSSKLLEASTIIMLLILAQCMVGRQMVVWTSIACTILLLMVLRFA